MNCKIKCAGTECAILVSLSLGAERRWPRPPLASVRLAWIDGLMTIHTTTTNPKLGSTSAATTRWHSRSKAGAKLGDGAERHPQLDGTTGRRGRCHGGSQQCVPHGTASSSRTKHTLFHTHAHTNTRLHWRTQYIRNKWAK